MKLPEASKNIYPTSGENIKAILDHYFPTVSDELIKKSLEQLMNNKKFSLNQIEFGANFITKNKELLDKAEFSELPSAGLNYAMMTIFYPRKEWQTSGANMKRLENFRQLYRDSFFENWPE